MRSRVEGCFIAFGRGKGPRREDWLSRLANRAAGGSRGMLVWLLDSMDSKEGGLKG